MTQYISLPGCRCEPLMNYLKALGALRLVSTQQYPETRGWWESDVFNLETTLDKQSLIDFFTTKYVPTPIVCPWSGGSGFFKKDNKKFLRAIEDSPESRCKGYAAAIQMIRRILTEEKIVDKPTDSVKSLLIRRYRCELPEDVVDWMDAAMILQDEGQAFAPILGTGGNDGRLDFSQNFMARLFTLGIASGKANQHSQSWLRCALFNDAVEGLETAAVGQFSPGRAGGANSTQGMDGDAVDNPWDFVLMLEGAVTLAGAAVRRLGLGEGSRVSFPFTVQSTTAGYGSASDLEGADSRGEIWLPLWDRPAGFAELRLIFSEGRAEWGGRQSRSALDFARSVSALGVDRGIRSFIRYGFLKRNGLAYIATPLARCDVKVRAQVDLLQEIDPWLDRYKKASDTNSPARFRAALRRIEEAILSFCRNGGTLRFAEILRALGAAEYELASAEHWCETKGLQPLGGLSGEWILGANDNSVEFDLALAIAGVHDQTIGPIRANLEPVTFRGGQIKWAGSRRSVVWSSSDLIKNLIAVLERRLIDGDREGCSGLASRHGGALESIALFVEGGIDLEKISELLWGLTLIDDNDKCPGVEVHSKHELPPLPRAYALLKLLFLPRPIVVVAERRGTRYVRFAWKEDRATRILPELRVLSLLRSGDLGAACNLAGLRLRASGLTPFSAEWQDLAPLDCRRLAAAILVPVTESEIGKLFDLVTRPQTGFKALSSAPRGDYT